MANSTTDDCVWAAEDAGTKDTLVVYGGVAMVAMAAVGLFGIAANLINIIVFLKMGMKDSVTIALFMLSISDLLYVLIMTPVAAVDVIWHFYPRYATRPYQHSLSYAVEILVVMPYYWADIFFEFSVFVALFLAIVRCMCVVRPLTFKHTFTKERTLATLAVLFLAAFCFRTGHMANVKLVRIPFKNSTVIEYQPKPGLEAWYVVWAILNKNVIFWICYIAMAICIIIMGIKLREASKFRFSARQSQANDQGGNEKQTNSPEDEAHRDEGASKNKANAAGALSAKDVQVLKNVTLICLLFIIFQAPWVPYSIGIYLNDLIPSGNFSVCLLLSVLLEIVGLFSNCNASVNIFVFYTCMPKYRELLLGFFCLRRC